MVWAIQAFLRSAMHHVLYVRPKHFESNWEIDDGHPKNLSTPNTLHLFWPKGKPLGSGRLILKLARQSFKRLCHRAQRIAREIQESPRIHPWALISHELSRDLLNPPVSFLLQSLDYFLRQVEHGRHIGKLMARDVQILPSIDQSVFGGTLIRENVYSARV
jgi:hypothetical protein